MNKLGYIGIGSMGGGIAQHLVKSGFDLTVFDLRPEAYPPLIELGAKKPESLQDLVNKVDIILICVENDQGVKDVCLGSNGILAYARQEQVIIIQSTVKAITVQEINEEAAKKGVGILDAPVSGDIDDRLNGTLSVMVGGEEKFVERCRPVLNAIGKNGEKVVHLGPVGGGEIGKLCNNLTYLVALHATLEALKLVHTYGISEEKIIQVISMGSGRNWTVDHPGYFDAMLKSHRLGPELCSIARKDLIDAASTAMILGINLPLTCVAAELMKSAFYDRAEYLGIL